MAGDLVQLAALKALAILLGDEVGGQSALGEPRVGEDGRQEWDVVADAAHEVAVQRPCQPGGGGGAVRRVGAQLGDHRVVVHRHLAALDDAAVDADALARGLLIAHQTADRRQEAAARVLGVDAGLDRPAVQPDIVLAERQRLAGRDLDHQLDQIDAGDQLGHRVLDLQPGVHLEEVEVAVAVDDELDRAGRVVADGAGQGHRLLAHGAARRLVQERRGRLLDDLLVAPLDRAFALAQVDDVAVAVAEDLDLDVARLDHVFLDEHAVVAER